MKLLIRFLSLSWLLSNGSHILSMWSNLFSNTYNFGHFFLEGTPNRIPLKCPNTKSNWVRVVYLNELQHGITTTRNSWFSLAFKFVWHVNKVVFMTCHVAPSDLLFRIHLMVVLQPSAPKKVINNWIHLDFSISYIGWNWHCNNNTHEV